MIEFRFKYRPVGCVQSSVKYFLAESQKKASKMFRHVCEKKKVKIQFCEIKKFNRWNSEWESVNHQ